MESATSSLYIIKSFEDNDFQFGKVVFIELIKEGKALEPEKIKVSVQRS